jgi:periplasmic divalent cation tolerance protein
MESTTTHIVVVITTSSKQEAETIANALVESRLAACVNIIPAGVSSLFWWQGAIERQDEVLMLVKSRSDLLPSVVEVVKGLHSYTVPEVIALPILAGSSDYLLWVDSSLRQTS